MTHLFRLPLSSASPLMCEPLARQVQAFGALTTSAEPMVRVPSRSLQRERVDGVGGEGCGGERGRRQWRRLWRPRKRWCRRRRPVVSRRLVLVLPAEDLRGRQLHISTAELAGCCRARLPRCAPAGTEPPVASAIAASVICGSSKRDGLAAGCSVASYSVAGM